MAQILFTPQASEDLLEVWAYIAADNTAAADRLLDAIQARLATLAESPHLGRLRDDLGRNLRSLPVGNYLIIYRPIKDGIEAMRVLHGARDLSDLF